MQQQARERSQASKRCAKSVDELMKQASRWLLPTQVPVVRRRLEDMPESCRITYVRALSGRSLTAGVKAHCLECVGWERDAVRNCTSLACPLLPYRPFK